MSRKLLWIPGPTEVDAGNLACMAEPVIGHRGAEIHELVASLKPGLRMLFGGTREVAFMTCSATSVMEAGLRSLVGRRALVCSTGAFGTRWHHIAASCGIASDLVETEPGRPFTPDLLRRHFRPDVHDAACFTHGETSTGVLNPVAELAAVVREQSDACVLVDAVSALAAAPLDFDAEGHDLVLAGVQKALALPPGLSVLALSERALARAETVAHRGFTTDLLRVKKAMDKDQTPATPSVSHLFALRRQLARIEEEGLPARFARHRAMSDRAVAWAAERGLPVLAQEGFRSPTVTCLGLPGGDPVALVAEVARRSGVQLGGGYGDLKPTHFRIGHMGEHDLAELEVVLTAIDALLEDGGRGGEPAPFSRV